jgi:hypothetical protein
MNPLTTSAWQATQELEGACSPVAGIVVPNAGIHTKAALRIRTDRSRGFGRFVVTEPDGNRVNGRPFSMVRKESCPSCYPNIN